MPILPSSAYTDPHREVVQLPDIEVVVGEYLKDQIGADATVYTSLPSSVSYTKPVVRVNRIGGTWRNRAAMLDEPILDIDVWHTNGTTLKEMVARTRAQLAAMVGVMHRGIVVTRVFEQAGPVRRPEDDPTLARIGFSVGLLVHPA